MAAAVRQRTITAPGVLVAMCLGLAGSAAAAPFNLADQFRTSSVSNYLVLQDANGNYDVFDLPEPGSTTDLGSFDPDLDRSLGFTTQDGAAGGSGQATLSQRSFIGPGLLSFDSRVGATAAGFSAAPPSSFSVYSYASASFYVEFDVTSPLWVTLTMDSELSTAGSSFTFDLSSQSGTVWTDEVLRDPVTNAEDRSFERLLALEPGHYTLSAGWQADARMSSTPLPGDTAEAAAHAFVSLTPVPEPGSWMLMLCGLACVAGAARRTRAPQRWW